METKNNTFALVYTNRATRKITFLGAFPTRAEAQAKMREELADFDGLTCYRTESHTNSARVFDSYFGNDKEYWHGTFEILKH